MNILAAIMFILGMVALWALCIILLGRSSYRAFKRNSRTEAILSLIVTIAIVLFSAQWVIFFVWAIGCSAGLLFSCTK